MKLEIDYYRILIQEKLAQKSAKNPRYSLRSFARALGVNSGALSQILSGKRIPSHRTAKKILEKLGVNADQRHGFMRSLAETHAIRGLERESVEFRRFRETLGETTRNAKEYAFIAPPIGWYYNAIQELTFVEGFANDAEAIAKRLEISVHEAQAAIDKLLAIGLLERDENGRLRKTQAKTRGHPDALNPHVSAQVIELHRQLLSRAARSVTDHSVRLRNARGLTFAFDPDRLPEARELIARFAREMSELAAQGPKKRVYQFEMVLFPLDSLPNDRE